MKVINMLSKQAYTESYYLICEMSEEMRNKIPLNIIESIKNNMDVNYEVNLSGCNIQDLKLLEDTEKILSVLYTDYIATPEERDVIKAKENSIKQQKRKSMPEIEVKELFQNKEKNNIEKNRSMIKVEKSNKWYAKIYRFIMKIFGKIK